MDIIIWGDIISYCGLCNNDLLSLISCQWIRFFSILISKQWIGKHVERSYLTLISGTIPQNLPGRTKYNHEWPLRNVTLHAQFRNWELPHKKPCMAFIATAGDTTLRVSWLFRRRIAEKWGEIWSNVEVRCPVWSPNKQVRKSCK